MRGQGSGVEGQENAGWIQRLIGLLPERARTPEFLRFIRYLVIGGLTTGVNYGVFVLLLVVLGWEENASNIVAVVCSVVFAYLTNKRFVFRTHCNSAKDLLREAFSFFSARAATIALEIAGVYLLVTLAGLPVFGTKAVLTVLIVLLNYIFSRWIFKNRN